MKDLDTLIDTLQEIYSAGDRDECSHKHIINGLCQLVRGGKPSNPNNYYDYNSCGVPWWFSDYELPYKEWPDDVFCEDLWIKAEDIFKKLSVGGKTLLLTNYNPFVFTDFESDHSFWLDGYDEDGLCNKR